MTWIAQVVGLAVGEAGDVVAERRRNKLVGERNEFLIAESQREAELIRSAGDQQMSAFLKRANETALSAARIETNTEQQVLEIQEQGRGAVKQVFARAASSGIDPTVGSPVELAAETAFIFEKQASLKDQQARFKIGALLVDQENLQQAAVNARFSSEQAAFSTLIGAIAQAKGLVDSLPTRDEKFSKQFSSGASLFGSQNFGSGGGGSSLLSQSSSDPDTGFSDLL